MCFIMYLQEGSFLKSDPVEMRHILDEFHRVAITNPQVHFSLFHNDNEVYYLPIQSLKARIIGLFGKSMGEVDSRGRAN